MGLARDPRRRAPGLRRAELAELAGLSVDYLVRLEQGRARNPSPQVLGSLSRALRLDRDERDHLFRLAGTAAPAAAAITTDLGPGVTRLLQQLSELPVGVFTAAWDLIWWNPLWSALSGDPAGQQGLERNAAWRHFTGAPSPIDFDDEHAEQFSHDLAADLREASGRYPGDTRLEDLISRLGEASPDFRRHWETAQVARHLSSAKTATTTAVGSIRLDCDVLTSPGSDLRIVAYTVVPGSEDASRLDRLRRSSACTPAFTLASASAEAGRDDPPS